MKRIILILLASLMLLTLASCKGRRDAAKMPTDEIKAQIATYAPLPSFKEAFRLLDDLKAKDYAPSLSDKLYRVQPELHNNAFALGVLTADVVFAAKARNKNQLTAASAELKKLGNLMGFQEEIKRLDSLLPGYIKQGKWSEVEKTLDFLKKRLEDKLWELEDYEYYTLMILGGWTEALNGVGKILTGSYSAEATRALSHENTWKAMQANLELFSAAEFKGTQTYKSLVDLTAKVSQLLASHTDDTYTKEQVEELIQLTEQLKQAFPK